MVTFRNNNNVRRNNFRRNDRNFKIMEIDLNLHQIIQTTIILKEKFLDEIIIMRQS
jgi:hypothetical protein